jgi:hypothetical protein
VANYPEAADRGWVAMMSNPRRTDDRQHQLKGQLAQTTVGGQALDHWQIEATAGGWVWYAIDDTERARGSPRLMLPIRSRGTPAALQAIGRGEAH